MNFNTSPLARHQRNACGILPSHFEFATDEAILDVIAAGVAKKGTNTWTRKEQLVASLALVEGRRRELMPAFRASFGFSWGDAVREVTAAHAALTFDTFDAAVKAAHLATVGAFTEDRGFMLAAFATCHDRGAYSTDRYMVERVLGTDYSVTYRVTLTL